jgi:hypothetical protein
VWEKEKTNKTCVEIYTVWVYFVLWFLLTCIENICSFIICITSSSPQNKNLYCLYIHQHNISTLYLYYCSTQTYQGHVQGIVHTLALIECTGWLSEHSILQKQIWATLAKKVANICCFVFPHAFFFQNKHVTIVTSLPRVLQFCLEVTSLATRDTRMTMTTTYM